MIEGVGTRSICYYTTHQIKAFEGFLEYPLRCHYENKVVSLDNKFTPTPESHDDVSFLIPLSQENLEIPIFDQNVMWQIPNVSRDTTCGFMLNDIWYEIDQTSSEKYLPLKDLSTNHQSPDGATEVVHRELKKTAGNG